MMYFANFICLIYFVYYIYYHNNLSITSVLIVYVICGEKKFSIHLSKYPVYELRCNESINYKDLYEGGLILDFLIETYNHTMADKYIFCHGHDVSYHYRTNFWKRINYISSTSYFRINKYGGIYCCCAPFGTLRHLA